MTSSETSQDNSGTTDIGGHGVPIGSPATAMVAQLPPLTEVAPTPRRSAAEEARTILAANVIGSLATLTGEGDPWASIITYGVLGDGSPVFSLSTLALHGRNVQGDRRASLAVSETVPPGRDPADSGRVTLAGIVEAPAGDELEAAQKAYQAAVASAAIFGEFSDFSWWVLRIERVRWVGGFGRMDSVAPPQLAAAEPDPVAPQAAHAVAHLNADHAEALLQISRTLAGHPDTDAATCVGADRYGLDLDLITARGQTPARVAFAQPVGEPDGLRAATVELAVRARELSS